MPDLSPETLQDIKHRLDIYLKTRLGYKDVVYLACGGSAATYSVSTPTGKRAIKAYDPKFLEGDAAQAEQRRLHLQRTLIGHDCKQLVSVYQVDEAEGTAFIEMEFVKWPRLKDKIAEVPDDCVSALITELVTAVVYLEKQGIVHRDIKPENIHVSPNFKNLKLLDLGVARGIDVHEDDSGGGTDQGKARPFIATAQYSSPEYLFRFEEPSPALWKGLNLYQVGAVLHDLINKRPLFQDEVDKENRWLVARAVLEKAPSFPDTDSARLIRQKALSARCLAKDGSIRLQIASWTDFNFEAPADALSHLHAKLAKEKNSTGAESLAAAKHRLDFERRAFSKRICDSIKSELIEACSHQIAISMYGIGTPYPNAYICQFSLSDSVTMSCRISFLWKSGLHARTATLLVSASLVTGGEAPSLTKEVPITNGVINTAEEISSHDVANALAQMLAYAIDLKTSIGDDIAINGMDIASNYNAKE